MPALGVIEVKGYAAAMVAADTMLKAAGVRIFKDTREVHLNDVIAVFIRGDDVGSVKAATDAGAEAAKAHGQVVTVHVIAKPDKNAVRAVIGDTDWDNNAAPQNWIP